MATIDINQIGLMNRQLVLDLAEGKSSSSGWAISDFVHDSAYNYDLSFGPRAHKDHPLRGTLVGIKYYCHDKSGQRDMKRRVVHIFDRSKPTEQKFFRLQHTEGKPGLYTNDYSLVEEITGWHEQRPSTLHQNFQDEALRLGSIDIT